MTNTNNNQPKHTPGPWHVGVKPGPIIYDDAYGSQIARMDNPFGQTDEENLANAHLIASAPDLLEALKEAHGQLEADILVKENFPVKNELDRLLRNESRRLLNKWQSIIAKAEGRAI